MTTKKENYYNLIRRLTDAATGVYCAQVTYGDGDTLSVSSVKSKPRETICILLGFKRDLAQVTAQRDELLAETKSLADQVRNLFDKNRELLAACKLALDVFGTYPRDPAEANAMVDRLHAAIAMSQLTRLQ